MRKLITIAAGMAVAAVTSHAAITFGTVTETGLTLSGTASWDLTPDPAGPTTWGGMDWSVSLSIKKLGGSYIYELTGYHVVAPHSGDDSPGDSVDIGALFPTSVGSLGHAQGTIQHNIVVPNGHKDSWSTDAEVKNGKVDFVFSAVHVPEPSTYAMIAGLGLMGFGIVRRMRRA